MMQIQFRIGIPMQIAQTQTPKMILGNYVRTDPRHQAIESDAIQGHCRIHYNLHLDLNTEWAWYTVTARYESAEQALLRRLSL